jgi:hypothetical protein
MGIRGSMMLMPDWARELTGLDHGTSAARLLSERFEQMKVDLTRWAYPNLPCVQMAHDRVTGAGKPAPAAHTAA